MPGFRKVLDVLESLSQQIKDEAFENVDDTKAVRLVHEGRGAAQLVQKLKATLATIEQSVREFPSMNQESPDWR